MIGVLSILAGAIFAPANARAFAVFGDKAQYPRKNTRFMHDCA
jgi:hypothetical protein